MTNPFFNFVAVIAQMMKEDSKMSRADWKQMQQHIMLISSDGLLSVFNSVIAPIIQQLKSLSFANQALGTANDLLLSRLMSKVLMV